MNKNFKEIINSVVSIGIVFIITGLVLKIFHSPNSEIYITMGTLFTVILMVGAFTEIILSKTMSNFSKAIWAVCLLAFKPIALLVYFYKREKEQQKSEPILK